MKKKVKYVGFLLFVIALMTVIPIFKTQAAHVNYSHGAIGLDSINGKSYFSDTSSRIFVKGWAFSDKDISSVTCDVGGEVIAYLKYGTSRPDINKKYSKCKTDDVGYEGYIPINKVPRGKQIINIRVNLKDNTQMRISFRVEITKKDNITVIESPQNDTVTNKIEVTGWALNASGIKNIGIFIDGKWVKNASYGSSRPDIDNAYIGYIGGIKSGYNATIDVSNIKQGNHKITVVAVGNDGSKQSDEIDVVIQRKPAKIDLESPANESVVKDSVTVTGWSIDDSGRKALDIYVNDKKCSSLYGVDGSWKLKRPDINKAYPGYPQGDYSGFSGTLDTTSWAPGTYKIKVVSTGVDGTVTSIERVVYKDAKPDRVYLEEPKGGDSVKDSVHIKGWVLTDSTVKSIKLYLDDKYIKDIPYGSSRPDVNKAYPNYPSGDNCGYEETVSIPNILEGTHLVKLIITLANGKEYQQGADVMKPVERTGDFETNIVGSTGWVAHACYLREQPSENSNYTVLGQGTVFRILQENGLYWKVDADGKQGWIKYQYCMINLPDLLPSIVYNITNISGSIFRSSGKSLPDVTGQNLYGSSKVYNNKIGRQEYIVPIQYSTAKKIAKVQASALKDGYCLKIYDAYRPHSVTVKIANSLKTLYNSDQTVKNNIDISTGASGAKYSWGQGWFLAQGVSAHNTGAALDVSLVRNGTTKDLSMPSAMHELSTTAIKYYSGTCTASKANYSKGMLASEDARRLDDYFTAQGFTTLASEWWHFQEQAAHDSMKNSEEQGCNFKPDRIVSTK